MTQTFQKYPMVMTHPNARKGQAVPIKRDAAGQASNVTDYQGVPDFMPPVTVNNEDQEERHAAMGYRPAGEANPAAYSQQVNAPQPTGYAVQEYPKWVGDKLVNSREEEDALAIEAAPADDSNVAPLRKKPGPAKGTPRPPRKAPASPEPPQAA